MFRKRQSAQEDIPDDILATIPEVGSKGNAPEDKPFTPVAPAAQAGETPIPVQDWKGAPAPRAGGRGPGGPEAAPLEADVLALVADVRRQMEATFSRELAKVEDSFTAALRQMDTRLKEARAEAEELRREKESLQRMNAEYGRKADALKELARSFERP